MIDRMAVAETFWGAAAHARSGDRGQLDSMVYASLVTMDELAVGG